MGLDTSLELVIPAGTPLGHELKAIPAASVSEGTDSSTPVQSEKAAVLQTHRFRTADLPEHDGNAGESSANFMADDGRQDTSSAPSSNLAVSHSSHQHTLIGHAAADSPHDFVPVEHSMGLYSKLQPAPVQASGRPQAGAGSLSWILVLVPARLIATKACF